MVPPGAPFVEASDIGKGSHHNKVTCIHDQTPDATKVAMGINGDQTPDRHMGQYKNELPLLMMARLIEWATYRSSFRI